MRRFEIAALVAATLTFGCAEPGPGSGDEHVFPARDFACPASDSSPECATTMPLIAEAERTIALPRTFEDTTLAYVVDQITLPRQSSGAAAGFNLDGLDVREAGDDSDCVARAVDLASSSDAYVSGIDNALEAFIPTIEGLLTDCPGGVSEGCLDSTLATQISQGALVLLVEIAGVNDYRYDDDVAVQVMLGQLVGGGVPTLGTDGRLAPGQEYEPAVSPSGTPLLLGPAYTGDVFAGRLRIHTDELALSIHLEDALVGDRGADLEDELGGRSPWGFGAHARSKSALRRSSLAAVVG